MNSPDTQLAKLRGRRVLITGGLGTLGSSLAQRLAKHAEVTLVDLCVPGYGANPRNLLGIEDSVRIHEFDIGAPEMSEVIRGQEWIFNLAGLGCHSASMQDPLSDLDMNARSHLAFLEMCRQHAPEARIVYTSTRQIYGRTESLPVTEDQALAPVDINGIHKLAGEQYHLLYERAHGLKTCCLRLTNVFGPRMRIKDARQVFFGAWMRCLLEGRPFEVWGGEQLRDISYIDDVVDALLAAAGNDKAIGQVFNVGSGRGVSLRELADVMIRAHGSGEYEIRSFPAERKRIDIGDYVADIRRIQSDLEWQPRVPLQTAAENTVAYYREHGAHYL